MLLEEITLRSSWRKVSIAVSHRNRRPWKAVVPTEICNHPLRLTASRRRARTTDAPLSIERRRLRVKRQTAISLRIFCNWKV